MAENYKIGENYYLPVRVGEIMDSTYTYPIRIEFENGNGCMDGKNAIKSNPGLLLTAEEIKAAYHVRINKERNERLAVLEKENPDLKEKATALKTECDEWKKKYEDVYEDNQALRTAIEELRKGWDKAQDKIALLDIINLTLAEKIEDLRGKG